MTGLSVVLPCYNEAASLEALVERNREALRESGLTAAEFELILVNNGSTDGSAAILDQITALPANRFVRTLTVMPNEGYGHGIHQGLLATRFPLVAWTHADEQCDPKDVFRAWKEIQDSPQGRLVKGARRGRRLGNWLFSRAFECVAWLLLRRCFHEVNAQPKVFSRDLLSHFSNPPKGFAYDLYVLLKAKEAHYKIEEIPVEFPPRQHGESKWASTFRSRCRTIRGLIQFMWQYSPKGEPSES